MSISIWLLYSSTVIIFMLTPGPSHLLMLSNSMAYGFRRSMATAAGDLSANALQMLAAGLGLAVLLVTSQYALTVIKWAGVAYLTWMGVRMWRRSSRSVDVGSAPTASLQVLWFQGFFTSAANPKAVVFFAALFPQFIHSDQAFWPQFLILSATYILIDGVFLCIYGASAGWLARRLRGRALALIDKVGATFLIGAAAALGVKTLGDR